MYPSLNQYISMLNFNVIFSFFYDHKIKRIGNNFDPLIVNPYFPIFVGLLNYEKSISSFILNI